MWESALIRLKKPHSENGLHRMWEHEPNHTDAERRSFRKHDAGAGGEL
jgi:hypothetical protein